jgi:hypothetical protein
MNFSRVRVWNPLSYRDFADIQLDPGTLVERIRDLKQTLLKR